MAAGGPKSASLAGRAADGVIVSVKEPADAVSKVIEPFKAASDAAHGAVVATRWCVLADDDEHAWEALSSMRGLRAPGRLEAVDPADLRARADDLPRADVLGSYAIARDAADLVAVYRPLVEQVGADYVSIQVASTDPDAAIRLIGREALPALRKISAQAGGGPSPARA